MAERRWRVLVERDPRSGAVNMATDQALLEEAERTGQGALRLYRWAPACVSFGRHEAALRRYDRELLEQLHLDAVRRPTGGRAVWHDDEVTYAVAAPITWFGSLSESYRAIHGYLAEALGRLGARATLAPVRSRHRSLTPDSPGDCFSAPVGGEVMIDGQKVIGSAQVRSGRAFLQHGSILLGGSPDTLRAVSRDRGPEGSATTLSTALDRTVTFDEVAAAVLASWEGAGVADSGAPPLPPPDRLTAAFRDPAWTWRR